MMDFKQSGIVGTIGIAQGLGWGFFHYPRFPTHDFKYCSYPEILQTLLHCLKGDLTKQVIYFGVCTVEFKESFCVFS